MFACCCGGGTSDPDDSSYARLDDTGPVRTSTSAAPEEIDVKLPRPVEPVSLEDFDLLKVVGKGSFGKVMQVRKRTSGKIYAMKVMRKEAIIKRNQVKHTRSERHILQEIRHPFIVQLHYAFQSEEKLYLVLSFLAGGELFFHLRLERRFSEARVRLYAAEICLALEALHSLDMIYRDLKPENILLDSQGHVVISDFGLAKEAVTSMHTANTFCGTPSYMAPEMLKGSGHGKGVDWWSFGTLIYEMLSGIPPFYSRNLHAMYAAILKGELRFPSHLSRSARQLLEGLLTRDVTKRLGSRRDADDIKMHAFFRGLNWEQVYNKGYQPEFVPKMASSTDTDNFDSVFTNEPPVDSVVEGHMMAPKDLFEGWDARLSDGLAGSQGSASS